MDISIIVPVVERYDDLRKLYTEYSTAFDKLNKSYEFVFVVSGNFSEAVECLKELKSENPSVMVIKLIKDFGESVALQRGVEKAKGDYIFTLASYFQVEPEAISTIWEELNNGYDLVIARRYPRIDSRINRIQSLIFHWLIKRMTSISFHDISCGLRGMKRKVLEEINLYGDLHRFIPILADKCGFNIKEIKAKQRGEDTTMRLVGSGTYVRRLLDILTVFFISKFTMKPLRFFGLVGITFFGIGSIITAYLGVYRLFGFGGIADRPLLLMGILLMVLGIQTLSIGLIGEILIFTHAREIKEYKIEEYLNTDES